MNNKLEEYALAYIAECYQRVLIEKPTATQLEIEGLAYKVLSVGLGIYINEQLSKSRQIEGSEGTPDGSRQIQEARITGGIEESAKGVGPGNTGEAQRSSRKKRRR